MGYIEGDIFVEVKQHTQHQSMAEEIQRLQCVRKVSQASNGIFAADF